MTHGFAMVAKGAAIALLAVAVSTCAGDAEEPLVTPAPEPPAPVGERQAVTGTAPVSTDGSLTVVMLEARGATSSEPPEDAVQMDQLGMEFLPPVLLAEVGQPVNFHNGEDIMHNVRVYNIDTKETAFNISTPIGGTYEHRFDTAGTYRVACDIHPQMGASVVITTTPYATVADRDGRFSFEAIAPGDYTAVVHAGADRTRHAVTIDETTRELSLGSD